jgi:hypothetical protein
MASEYILRVYMGYIAIFHLHCKNVIRISAEDTSSLKISIDGSHSGGIAGAAAILIRGIHPSKILHYYLGLLTQHNITDAEAIRVILGLHLLRAKHNH